MNSRRIYQGFLSMVFAAALFLCPILSASAEEIPDESASVPTETAQSPESSEATAPPETTVPPETTMPPETTVPPETTAPPETTTPPKTAPPTQTTSPSEPEPSEEPIVTPVTITQAWDMPSGTKDITIQGTVVFAMGNQAVLQDCTGGIRLSFSSDTDVAMGEVLQVTGMRSGGLYVDDFALLGTAELPALETTLLDAPENLRIAVKNALLGDGILQDSSFSMTLDATLPEGIVVGSTVDALGVILDGRFYADTLLLVAPPAAPSVPEWNTYFGQLHAHTALSDGTGSITEAFAYAAGAEGLDFFAVTDHSDSFDHAGAGVINEDGSNLSTEWAAGKAAAAAVTDETFVGLFGYEMSWPEDAALGHIGTFNTPGWQAWGQADIKTLTDYYDALTTVPNAIGQFNHPGHVYGTFQHFDNFTFAYDEVMRLIEIGNESGADACSYYDQALGLGWHLAPVGNHSGGWNDGSTVRTVVLAKELSEASLYDAMANYRVYATRDSDLEIHYRLNGHIMGSIIGPVDNPVVSVYLKDPTDIAIGTVEVVVDNGISIMSQNVAAPTQELTLEVPGGYRYYYLRITQPDGDIAVTAPVWVKDYMDVGITCFDSDSQSPVQGQEVTLTLELYNHEKAALTLDEILLTVSNEDDSKDPTVIHPVCEPGTVPGLGSLSLIFPFTWQEAGSVQLTVTVTGTINGCSQTLDEELSLRVQSEEAAIVSTIADVRSGTPGTSYRVKGYVTTGNSNPYNTFPNVLYLQDDTGGIAVTDVTDIGIEVGTAMEVSGVLRESGGNLVLESTAWDFPEENRYRFVPQTMYHSTAMNYAAHGGELLQIEGTVVSLVKQNQVLTQFTLKDIRGDLATVRIEGYIRSGAYGTNELASQVKKGRTVRAIGLLHVSEFGTVVLRVRNCDEVVYVPPKADPTNPKTGDRLFFWR